jgi:hypothetical protein
MPYIDRDKLKDDIAVLFERNEELIDEWLANCVDDVIDEQPTADVVEKELYNRLLEDATIMAEALKEYQTAGEE